MLLKNEFSFMPKSKIKASEGKANGLYPFFTSSNLKVKRIDEFLFNDELIIIGTGGLPSCNYYDGKFGVSTDNFVLKSKGNILPKYLYYYLRNNNLRILADGFRGTGLKHISKDYVSKIEIPFASIDKQELIVKVGNSINTSIEKCQSELNYLNMIVKSRFIELFGNPDLSFQNSGWQPVTSFSRIITGTTPSTDDPDNWDGNVLWITPAEIEKDAFYLFDTKRKLTEKGRKSKSLSLMPVGTVILSTRAPIGKVAIVGKEMTCNQGFKNFICNKNVNPVYLYFLLKFNSDYLNSIGSGTTFKEISKSKIETLRMPIPPIDLQNKFETFVKQIDKLKFNVKKRIELYQELLNKKMDEYFN